MATRTWDGSTGNFSTASSWSGGVVPVSGDTAIINAGSVSASGTISGVAIQLNELAGATASTTLTLNGATLDAAASLTVNNANSFNNTAPTISTTGRSILAGTSTFSGNQIALPVSSGSTLVNTGTLNFLSSSPTFNGGGTFENDGNLALVNPNALTQIPVISDAVTGTGTFSLGKNARVSFFSSVAASQTVVLDGGNNGNEVIELDQLSTFGARVSGFSASDLIAVVETFSYTNATYTSTGTNSGTLNLFGSGSLQGSITFNGSYSLSSFTIKPFDLGNGTTNLQITTSSTSNAAVANLPSGTNTAPTPTPTPTPTVVGPVYRFFDKNTGTHFFTSDDGERNTTRTLPNYVQEANDFGDVPQADPNGEAVYRFFDTRFGTHFFTASLSERDDVIKNRSDLTYEQGSSFYEHASQQAGDVAVFRFFDTQFGTHFYTGDANEAASTAALRNSAGNATYINEGVGFYAPAGTFT